MTLRAAITILSISLLTLVFAVVRISQRSPASRAPARVTTGMEIRQLRRMT